MLFIFRKLRRSFFLPGKVRTYVAYAVGEIALIMIGILLAVQVSDWNDRRKESQEETIILQGLRSEFQGYINSFTNGKTMNFEPMVSAMKALLRSMEAGDWMSEEWTFEQAIGKLRNPPTTNPGNGIRDALAQGGRMEIISNQKLRDLLTVWPRYHEELLDDQEIGRKIVLDTLDPYFISQGLDLSAVMRMNFEWPTKRNPFTSNPAMITHLLSDPKFKTIVQIRYGFWEHTGQEYDNAIQRAEEILTLIDTELAERGIE